MASQPKRSLATNSILIFNFRNNFFSVYVHDSRNDADISEHARNLSNTSKLLYQNGCCVATLPENTVFPPTNAFLSVTFEFTYSFFFYS
jgi:hypothetical protein